ncbi:hypothetical protein KM043_007908 [Ampulex compressa]|nr:hypothetical protein KM043_007908 [Ampulex compressa]
MNLFQEDPHLRVSRLMLLAIGLWPGQRGRYKYLPRFLICFSFFSLLFVQLQQILERIQYHWRIMKAECEIRVMNICVTEAWFYGKTYLLSCFAAAMGFVLLACEPFVYDLILPGEEPHPRIPPFGFEYLIDPEKYYYPILLHIQSTSMVALFAITAIDVAYLAIAFHACGLYNVLGYVQLVLSCYATSYVLQFFVITVAIVGLLFNLYKMLNLGNHVLAVLFVVDLLGHYFIIFLNLIPGQRVMDYSSTLMDKTWNGYWYSAPVKSQKLALFLMQGIQKPYVPSAAGLMDMTFEMFGKFFRMGLGSVPAVVEFE